jgi:hypothetical protein
LDIYLFQFFKKLTKGKLLWLRATGSTLISQIFDSFVVSYIAFDFGKRMMGVQPATLYEVFRIASSGYVLKFIITTLITPLLYVVRGILEQKYGLRPMSVV